MESSTSALGSECLDAAFVRVKLRSSHRVRWLVLALALATLGVAACGGDDGDENEAATTAAADSDISTDAGQAGEEIVIKTQVKINAAEENVGSNVSRGEILDGSSIGDSPFCPTERSKMRTRRTPPLGSWTERFSAPTAT